MTDWRDGTVRGPLLAATLGILVSGCSFASVQRPRPPAAVQDPRVLDTCTASSAPPIADTVLGGVGLVAGYVATVVALLDETSCVDSTTSSCHSGSVAPGLAMMAAGAVFAGSAVYGYVSTAQCRRRVVVGGRCANGDLNACQKLKPGWVPPPGWRAGAILEPKTPPAPSSEGWIHEPSQPRASPNAP